MTRPTQIDECNWFNGIFIRAPGIVSIEDKEQVQVLATLPNDSGNTQKPSCTNGIWTTKMLIKYTGKFGQYVGMIIDFILF